MLAVTSDPMVLSGWSPRTVARDPQILTGWTPKYAEGQERDERGRFGSGGAATSVAPTVMGDYQPQLRGRPNESAEEALQRAASAWGYWQTCITDRIAAETLLGEPHVGIGSAQPSTYNINNPGLLDVLSGERPPTPRDYGAGMAAFDDAYKLLTGVKEAEPSTETLYRAVTIDTGHDVQGILGLKASDTFDVSLASFSGNESVANDFLHPGGTNVQFVLEPGAKAVAVADTETQILEGGKPLTVHNDNVVSGRMQVTNVERVPVPGALWAVQHGGQADFTRITIRQSGVFDPNGHGALVKSARYHRPDFWQVFDPQQQAGHVRKYSADQERVPAGEPGGGEFGGGGGGGGGRPWEPEGFSRDGGTLQIPANLSALSPENQAEARAQIAKLPPDVAAILRGAGVKIEARDVAKWNERGTIDYGGFWDKNTRTVVLSDKGFRDDRSTRAEGGAPFVLHELGHAFDTAVGDVTQRPEFRSLWRDAKPAKGSYWARSLNGTDPRRELFAEACAHVWNGTEPQPARENTMGGRASRQDGAFTLTPYLRQIVNELRVHMGDGAKLRTRP